jgi:hypothetical protein
LPPETARPRHRSSALRFQQLPRDPGCSECQAASVRGHALDAPAIHILKPQRCVAQPLLDIGEI